MNFPMHSKMHIRQKGWFGGMVIDIDCNFADRPGFQHGLYVPFPWGECAIFAVVAFAAGLGAGWWWL